MKTIFYEQNQLNISNKSKSGFLHVYHNPSLSELKFILDLFLNSKNYYGHIIGDSNKIFKQIKGQFIDVRAAGGLVLNTNNEVLMIHRLGKWDLPKGKLEVGETKKNGAIREVEEECGISNLQIIKKLKSSYHIYPYKNNWALKTSYWYLMKYEGNEMLKPQLEENIKEALWIDMDNFDSDEMETYPAILKVLHQSLFVQE